MNEFFRRKPPDKRDPSKPFKIYGLATMIPLSLAVGPFVGAYLGSYLDHYFHTKWLAVTFVFLGLGASARMVADIMKKISDLSKPG